MPNYTAILVEGMKHGDMWLEVGGALRSRLEAEGIEKIVDFRL
jgi:hypothetical protein